MKSLFFLVAIFFAHTLQAESYQYIVHPGDVLEISVWKEEALQREVRVLPDGSISFPLAGIINVGGKPLSDVQKELSQKISEFIPEPVVNISIKSAEGNAVYVIGQVKTPGRFTMYLPMDVMQVLSLAGGLTPFAKADDIVILRRTEGTSKSIEFKYSDIANGEKLDENHLLKTGDVIVVP